MTDPTRAELEQAVAERLAAACGAAYGVPLGSGDLSNAAGSSGWLAVARESIAMWECMTWAHWKAVFESIQHTHGESHPGCHSCAFEMPAMDLRPALETTNAEERG